MSRLICIQIFILNPTDASMDTVLMAIQNNAFYVFFFNFSKRHWYINVQHTLHTLYYVETENEFLFYSFHFSAPSFALLFSLAFFFSMQTLLWNQKIITIWKIYCFTQWVLNSFHSLKSFIRFIFGDRKCSQDKNFFLQHTVT